LVVNGSFEEPNIGGGYSIFGSITGWYTTFGPGIEIQNNTAGSPFDGAQHVELDSDNSSGMAQSIPTVPGATYNLSFWVSQRPGAGADNGLEVSWNGGVLDTILPGAGGDQTAWFQKSY
jgi:hypothetical protein